MISKPTIALGPEIDRQSWDWVGFDVGRELSKYFNVVFFPQNARKVPEANLVFFIKMLPHPKMWMNARDRSIKMVYCPIDYYRDESHIHSSANFLRQCETILVHCERLLPVFEPYCKRVQFVEHHNRFGLIKPSSYKPNGYAVWVGHSESLTHAFRWLVEHPLGLYIKFLTDSSVPVQGLLPIQDPHEIIDWNPLLQRDVMAGAKVAFDIKGLDFNQMHKPPVKAQQFIASGIPFATNLECYSAEYFAARGFQIVSFVETDRWFSQDYWRKTTSTGEELRTRLTLENVGLHYKRIVETLLNT